MVSCAPVVIKAAVQGSDANSVFATVCVSVSVCEKPHSCYGKDGEAVFAALLGCFPLYA